MSDKVFKETKVGRPAMYTTKEQLQEIIDKYFSECDNREREAYDKKGNKYVVINPAPYTMSGLARRLGMERQTLINYSNRDEFVDTIREARNKVQEDVERRMLETRNEKGAQFSLTNNFGWRVKQETDITTGGKPIPILGGITTADVQTDNLTEKDPSSQEEN